MGWRVHLEAYVVGLEPHEKASAFWPTRETTKGDWGGSDPFEIQRTRRMRIDAPSSHNALRASGPSNGPWRWDG